MPHDGVERHGRAALAPAAGRAIGKGFARACPPAGTAGGGPGRDTPRFGEYPTACVGVVRPMPHMAARRMSGGTRRAGYARKMLADPHRAGLGPGPLPADREFCTASAMNITADRRKLRRGQCRSCGILAPKSEVFGERQQ